jgi:hypothetical protein
MRSTSKLQAAQQKLNAVDVPFELRVVAYLRLSCSVLKPMGMSYTGLLQALSQHNREWLKTCQITKSGMLKSSDRIINECSCQIWVLNLRTETSAW